MSVELYINNQLCEAPNLNKEPIAHSRQVNNIAELVNRQSNYTNQFKLPRTAINRNIFENAEQISSSTIRPYRKLNARLVEDGIEIIPSGYAVLQKSNKFYNVIIYSGNSDFFTQIDSKHLCDLDLSAFNHVWDLTTVVASRNNTSGYIYPLIDYSDDTETQAPPPYFGITTRNVDVRTLFSAMFVHTLIELIVAQTDYKLAGKILLKPKYLKRLLAFSLDSLKYNQVFVDNQLFKARTKIGRLFIFPMAFGTGSTGGSKNGIPVTFDDDISIGMFDKPNTFNTILGEFTIPVGGNYTFTVDTILTMFTGNPAGAGYQEGFNTAMISIYKKGTSTVIGNTFIQESSNFIALHFITTAPSVLLQKGDIIAVKIDCSASFTFWNDVGRTIVNTNPTNCDIVISENSIISNTFDSTVAYGGNIIMSGLMPDISQKDFFKDIMQQLCIIPDADNLTKILTLKQFGELYDNIPNSKDITDKIDMNNEPEISYHLDSYAQNNIFKYDNDITILKTGLGQGSFTIDDQTLPSEKILIKSVFSSTADVIRLNGLNVCNIPKLHAGAFKNSTAPRIVMLNTVKFTDALDYITYRNLATSVTVDSAPLTYFSNSAFDDSLDYFNLLVQEYKDLISMLTKLKLIIVKVNLTAKDFNSFDHFLPWYAKQYSQNFYVNLIENYQREKLTTVHLIRM